MAKKTGQGMQGIEVGRLPPPSFYKAQPKAEPAPKQKAVAVPGQDLLDVMKAHGNGWDERLAALIKAPDSLYKRTAGNMTQYSKSGKFEIDDILSGLALHRVGKGFSDYGAAFYSTQGSVYFVFADMERGVIVKERVFCIHDNPPEKSWSGIADSIEAAIAYSESQSVRKQKLVVVYDQLLSAIKPE